MTANTTASVRAFAGRRWLCLISAMVICVCAGFGYAWSVLQTPIIARFGWADSGVALAYTITVVCSTMAAACPAAFAWPWGPSSLAPASSPPA